MRLAVPLAALALVASGCGAAASSDNRAPVQTVPSPRAHSTGGRPAHIAVIVMENEEYGDIIGSRATPYLNMLAARYSLATSMYAITHPSLPNYLALTGGSTFGTSSDCTDCIVTATSIVDQLEHAGITWKAYMEDYPGHCYTGAGAGEYAKKHDPFIYYTRIFKNPAWCADIVPLDQLAADERAGTLPAFLWITPNLCHDMHDCSPATGDKFLSGLVPPLLHALGARGLLFLTWDEGTSGAGCCKIASGGHIATIVAGGGARRAGRLRMPADHYSVLQTIEDLLGLPRLRGAACACTASLQPLVR